MNVPIVDNDLKAVLSNQNLGVLATTGERDIIESCGLRV